MKIEDQPPPVPRAELRAAWDLVIEDVQAMLAQSPAWNPSNSDPRFAEHLKRIHDLAIADMRERDRVGRERYGTPLTAHNGRDQLVDGYQEALDLAVYLRAAIEEGHSVHTPTMMAIYADHLSNTIRLRGVIELRDNRPTYGKSEIVPG